MAHLTYLITGASRGIGLEFVRQLTSRGATIVAAVRDPAKAGAELRKINPKLEVVALDVADPGSIEGLGRRLGGKAIDVLINNAGVGSEAKNLALVDAAELQRVFQVNTFAPLLVTKALMPNLKTGTRKLVVNVTSILASIASNTGGSSYAYRASKTALNQLNKSLSIELAPDGFTCVAIHPGWVKTDMGGPNAHLTVQESVGQMLGAIDRLTAADTGKYLNYDGNPLPW